MIFKLFNETVKTFKKSAYNFSNAPPVDWREMGKTIGKAIREQRKAKKISAAKLGEMLDPPVTFGAVYAWENERNEPSVRYLSQISDILCLDFSKYVGSAEKTEHPDYVSDLVESCEKMSEAQRAAILTVVKSMVS